MTSLARARLVNVCSGFVDRYLPNDLRPHVRAIRSLSNVLRVHERGQQLMPGNFSTPRTCRDGNDRKEPLHSADHSRNAVAAVGSPDLGDVRDRFRDNRGDNSALVNRDVVYT